MAQHERKPQATGSREIASGRLPLISQNDFAKFEYEFKALLLGPREEALLYAKSNDLKVDSEEVRGVAWKGLVKSTEKAKELFKVTALRAPGSEVERVLREVLSNYITHGEWRESQLFIKNFVPNTGTNVFNDEGLRRATAYFAADQVMAGKSVFANALVDTVTKAHPEFFRSEMYAQSLRDGASLILREGKFSDFAEFVRKYPKIDSFHSEKFTAVEDAITHNIPERDPSLVKLTKFFKLTDFFGSKEFQKLLEIRLEHYLASRDTEQLLKMRENFGELVTDQVRKAVKPELDRFINWQMARIDYLRGEREQAESPAQALARLDRLDIEATLVSQLAKFLALPANASSSKPGTANGVGRAA